MQQLEIKQLNVYSVWRWKSDQLNKNCNICKNGLDQVCLHCQSDLNEEIQICQIALGQCSHIFHKHCIERWINDKSHGKDVYTCAYCNEMWNINNQVII